MSGFHQSRNITQQRSPETVLVLVSLLLILGLFAPHAGAQSGAAETDRTSLQEFGWILGTWQTKRGSSTTGESWTRVSAQTFEGSGGVLMPDGLHKPFEALRLVAMGDGVFYLAKVRENKLPVAFALVESGEQRAVFENRGHDFPQRLTYERKGNTLEVTVEGGEDVSGFTLRFENVAND